ncbi:GDSL esterase/lipase At2g04570-like [Telopea speciosissima]|uniref:GDSL esterase/lipase At2g04570-like n=1 Tax=Telopea speciosissima TaxID=54955 RepID=UPI001CC7FA63|nr:GDSL esterase/lipase At2g04570-like [Telopea speciosissima]
MMIAAASPSHKTIQCLFLFIFLVAEAVPSRAKVPAVIVFGDSSVDSGNNNRIQTILKSNFEPYGRDFEGGHPTGRFCNGRIPPDFISEALGLKHTVPAYLDPRSTIKDFATGVCFASAGTGYDNATSDVLNVIPLWKQLENYKMYQKRLRKYVGMEKAEEILREALYLMSIGTNDFLENFYVLFSRRSSQFTVEQYEDFLVGIAENFVRQLYELGGRKISLGGLPPMGCLPLERSRNIMSGSGCVDEYNQVAMDFNVKLQGLVIRLREELPEIRLVFSDLYHILLDVANKPSSYGFESAAVACCATGLFEMGYLCDEHSPFTCADANQYVFWDSFHPTQRTNQIMSDHLMITALSEFLV